MAKATKKSGGKPKGGDEAPKEEKALVPKATPGELGTYNYGDDAGSGYEGQTVDHLMIPFFSILQSNSPQVEDKTVVGAESGMLFDTVSEELFEQLCIVVAYKEQVYVEWKPRTAGGGFVGVHQVGSDVVKAAKDASEEFGKFKTPEGNDLQETFYLYVVVVDEEGKSTGKFGVIAFTSTKIKKYKRWNTAASQFSLPNGQKPPLFAHRVLVETVKEENNHGKFYNFKLNPAVNDEDGRPSLRMSLIPPGNETMDIAREFAKQVREGMARAAYDTQETEDGTPF